MLRISVPDPMSANILRAGLHDHRYIQSTTSSSKVLTEIRLGARCSTRASQAESQKTREDRLLRDTWSIWLAQKSLGSIRRRSSMDCRHDSRHGYWAQLCMFEHRHGMDLRYQAWILHHWLLFERVVLLLGSRGRYVYEGFATEQR